MGTDFDIESAGWLASVVLVIWAVYQFWYKNRAEIKARKIISALLSDPEYKQRSFKIIRRRVGGFDDAKLRILLLESGAVRFEADDREEMWGLESRNSIAHAADSC